MRKLFLLIALFGVLAVGCEELFPTEQMPNAIPIFETDSESSYLVSADGEEITIMVTTNIDYSVVIPKDAEDWLSVVCTRSETHEEILSFVVAPNGDIEERTTKAELVDGNGEVIETISFIQEGQSKVFDIDGNGNYTVVANGGNVKVVVTTNIEYSVVIPANVQSWLNVADSRAVRNETITFIVAENEAFEKRTATVKLVDSDNNVLQQISFIQDAQTEIFVTDGEENYIVAAEGGEFILNVVTNLEYRVVIPTDVQSWLSVADTRAVRVETLTFIVAPNTTYENRTAIVKLVNDKNKALQTISFIQDAAIEPDLGCPSDEIWYTNGSTTEVTKPNATGVFGANILSNTYDVDKECWVIKFDGDVNSIGNGAFKDCSSLTSVTIPDSVTLIGIGAFYGCKSFTSVTIPNSVTTIGDYAFSGCSSLTSVTIPESVTTIRDSVFGGCANLVSITIPEGVTSIGARSFSSCVSLVSVTIPNSVTEIGYLAFEDCSNLTSVYCKAITQPNTITGVVGGSSNPGAGLPNIPGRPNFPSDTIIRYGWEAFNGNASDRKIYVPAGSAVLYKYADYWSKYADAIVCYNFIKDEVVDGISNNEIWYTNGSDNVSIQPYSTDVFGANILSNLYDDEKCCWVMKFDGDVTSIGDFAFNNCSTLKSITIPDSVTAIGDSAFRECTGLEIFYIGNSVTTIGERAFYNCSNITKLIISNGVTTIGTSAFESCRSLKTVTLPDSVTKMGSYAFYGCHSLEGVYCKPTTPPTGGNYMFDNNADERKIYVPEQSISVYQSKSYWSNYADAIEAYNF